MSVVSSDSTLTPVFIFTLKCLDGEVTCNGRQMAIFNVVKSMESDLKIKITSLEVPFSTQIVSLIISMLERTDKFTYLYFKDIKWRDFVNCVNWFDPVDYEFTKYCLDAVISNCTPNDEQVTYERFILVFENMIYDTFPVVKHVKPSSEGSDSDGSNCSFCEQRDNQEREYMRRDLYTYLNNILEKCGIE